MFFVEEERQLAIWERDAAPAQVESQLQRQLEELKAPNLPPRSAEETAADADLLPWRLAMLGITASWGANFAVIKLALDTLGDTSSIADASSLFTAARFGISALLLCPFIMGASSRAVVNAGLGVGGLCAAGYACQVVSLSMGTQAGTSAFICSLQAVVVALLVARSTGCVAGRTWAAIGLSVAGVACLELPSVLSGGSGLCLGDLLAFGQPLGFGASYVVLQRAAADATEEDSLPLAALQCAAIGFCGLAAATLSAGQPPWDLDWSLLLPRPDAANALKAWAVPGAVLYTGVISSALTIWLQVLRILAALARVLPRLDGPNPQPLPRHAPHASLSHATQATYAHASQEKRTTRHPVTRRTPHATRHASRATRHTPYATQYTAFATALPHHPGDCILQATCGRRFSADLNRALVGSSRGGRSARRPARVCELPRRRADHLGLAGQPGRGRQVRRGAGLNSGDRSF